MQKRDSSGRGETILTITSGASPINQKRKIKLDIEDLANVTLFIAAFLGIWQLVFMLGIWPHVSLPSPAMVAGSFVDLVKNLTLIISIAVTMYRLVIGFALSIIIGVSVGLAMVKFPGFGKTMSSFAVGLQSFPSVAWVPFAILLIGLNDAGILFVVIMSLCLLGHDVHIWRYKKHITDLYPCQKIWVPKVSLCSGMS